MKRPGFRHGDQPVLHIAVTDLDAVEEVAWFVARQGRPGDYRLFNVDFSREFRYCLEHGLSASPKREPTTLRLTIPERDVAAGALETVAIDGEEYRQATRGVAALERADDTGLQVFPGQSVQYVVVDSTRGRDRVRLVDEADDGEYDVEFYEGLAIRATESILSPMGWREQDIRSSLSSYRDTSLSAY
ncbi:hypothetical protein [Halomarina litorea]|uniref:hypothetical protein n=1 Tax=Halomarina litorea TaxID=2961595 RepID=UPI0020C30788|nr:hypothetical protein [Halomarina sp. BCD28]